MPGVAKTGPEKPLRTSAGIEASLVVTVAGVAWPALSAYNALFIISAVAAIVAAIAASFVPTTMHRGELANPDLPDG